VKDEQRTWTQMFHTLAMVFRLWQHYPHLRLGQLLSHLAKGKDLFYLKDEELIDRVHEVLRKEQQRGRNV
jgi:hypothetical protein